jgi:hypothetical protein
LNGCDSRKPVPLKLVRSNRQQSSPIVTPERHLSFLLGQLGPISFPTAYSPSDTTFLKQRGFLLSVLNSLQDDRKTGETLMKKAMLLTAAFTLCAGLALAQDTPSNGTASQNETTTKTTTSTTDQSTSANTIQGCLMGTMGNYMLTDAAGVSYKVQGDDSQLSSNVNKEVEVRGTVASTASASASNSADTNAPNSSSTSEQPNQGGNPDASGAGGASTGATATATASKTLNASSIKAVADSCSNSK